MKQQDWDQRYAGAPGGLFGTAPSLYLRQVAARPDFLAKSALLLADGDGRNSRWLAARGIAVTAVDLSPVAIKNAQRLDQDAGVQVKRLQADLESWQPQAEAHFDAAFILSFHAPWPLRQRVLQMAWSALAPGGWLVLDGFSSAQAERPGGPTSTQNLYDLDAIADALPAHRALEALSGIIELNEGPRHRGEMAVVHYLAAKP